MPGRWSRIFKSLVGPRQPLPGDLYACPALAAIANAADRLERERMEDWVEAFSGALERDLIDVADFARER